jgi:starch phosphorylase
VIAYFSMVFVQVYLGEIAPEWVRIELYAELVDGEDAPPGWRWSDLPRFPARPTDSFIGRACRHSGRRRIFTPRVIPFHPEARIPIEADHIPLATVADAF